MVCALREPILVNNFRVILIIITLNIQTLDNQQLVRCSSFTEVLFPRKAELKNPWPASSTEAEYYAAGDAAREAVWLRLLLETLDSRQTEPSPLFCDNQSAIRLVHNPEFYYRTKHIAMKFRYIRQVFSERKITMFFIPTTSNLAEIFTKALLSVKFTALRTAMGVVAVPSSNN